MNKFKFFKPNYECFNIVSNTRRNYCLDLRDSLNIPHNLWLEMLMVSNNIFYFNGSPRRIHVDTYGAVEYVRMFYPQRGKQYAHFIITIDNVEKRFKVCKSDNNAGLDITLIN